MRKVGRSTWRDFPKTCPSPRYFNAGDTGFFSLTKPPGGAEDEWVIANYSSTCHSHAPWIYGQVFATDIFVCHCRTSKKNNRAWL
mmetsp:Transcript_121206/g.388237  ORF Transcript_121206/g.388237 Transcript_121206/m.388237 type:complete len:85 (-) Transcript_121206:57-311(-)